ncbi:MAG: hypothetical protein U0V74_05045 [Chitinophagales bacterium]
MVQYKTKGTTLPTVGALIAVMFGLGTAGMYLAILCGAGAIVSMLALMGPMVLAALFFGGEGFYWIDENGIGKTITSSINYKKLNSSTQEYFTWKEVVSFKHGQDLNRSLNQYEYLEIKLPGSRIWQITDEANKADFVRFRAEFLSRIQTYNAVDKSAEVMQKSEAPHMAAEASTTKEVTSPRGPITHNIKQEISFYERPVAHLIFWIIFGGVVYVAYFLWQHPGYIKATYVFRFAFIIVPGLLYFFYRLYGKKK